jgi:hypothetical protein
MRQFSYWSVFRNFRTAKHAVDRAALGTLNEIHKSIKAAKENAPDDTTIAKSS